jgi:hypothetical protein
VETVASLWGASSIPTVNFNKSLSSVAITSNTVSINYGMGTHYTIGYEDCEVSVIEFEGSFHEEKRLKVDEEIITLLSEEDEVKVLCQPQSIPLPNGGIFRTGNLLQWNFIVDGTFFIADYEIQNPENFSYEVTESSYFKLVDADRQLNYRGFISVIDTTYKNELNENQFMRIFPDTEFMQVSGNVMMEHDPFYYLYEENTQNVPIYQTPILDRNNYYICVQSSQYRPSKNVNPSASNVTYPNFINNTYLVGSNIYNTGADQLYFIEQNYLQMEIFVYSYPFLPFYQYLLEPNQNHVIHTPHNLTIYDGDFTGYYVVYLLPDELNQYRDELIESENIIYL